jgi:hypothetical protein
MRERIKEITINASMLSRDNNPEESVYRVNLEERLFSRFGSTIVWYDGFMLSCSSCRLEVIANVNNSDNPKCKGEKWSSDYEAEPSEDLDARKLKHKRSKRRPCLCGLSGPSDSARAASEDKYVTHG